MNFQVNDSVRIKSGLVEGKYGEGESRVYFNPEMAKYIGMTAIVTATNVGINDNKYELDIDNGDWCWNDSLVESV